MQKRVPKQIFNFTDKYQSKSRTREQNIDKGAYRQVERETEGCIYADQDRIELPTETFSAAISVLLVVFLSQKATLQRECSLGFFSRKFYTWICQASNQIQHA